MTPRTTSTYEEGRVVLAVADTAGMKQLDFVQRPDSSVRYFEWTLENDEYAGQFWNPTRQSGLFADIALAVAEARADLIWFREVEADTRVAQVESITTPDRPHQ
jgi:hypothetical protein